MKKRWIVILTTTAMMTAAAAGTAYAEGPDSSGTGMGSAPQMQAPAGTGQQAPQMQAPSGNNQQAPQDQPQMQAPTGTGKQAPQMQAPSGDSQQMPQMQAPSGDCQQQTPSEGKMNHRNRDGHRKDFLDEYVSNGTISQETYDAIKKYMEENKPDRKEDARKDLLQDLFDNGVITQEEYDAMAAARPARTGTGQDTPADGTQPQMPAAGSAAGSGTESMTGTPGAADAESSATVNDPGAANGAA